MTPRPVPYLAAAILLIVPFSSSAEISAEEARSLIADIGARGAMNAWWPTQTWQDIYDGIASGDIEWLQIAELLRRVSDAGSSEDLSDAISEALPKNPEVILRFVKDGKDFEEFTVEGACFASPRSEKSSEALNYLKTAEHAVKNVDAPDLQDAKVRCLKSLDESLNEVLSWPAR